MTLPKPRKVTKLTDLQVHEVSLVDAGANQGARVVLFKRDAGPPGLHGEPVMADDKTAPTLEDLDKAVKAAADDNAKITAEKAKLEAETAELRKQLADATAAAAAKAAAESTDLTKRLEAETTARASLEKRLAQIEDERELGQYVAKAADYKHLPMTPVELAPALRAISKLAPEHAEVITKMLSATSEQLGKALESLPYVRADVPASAGEAEFQALVDKRMAEKGEDEAKATDEVAKTDAGKKAYRRMVAEQRAN